MNSFRFPMRNTKKRVNIISTRQSIKPFRKIRKEVLRYQTIVTRLCYGESGYSTLFFASRKDYTNTHTFLCQSLFFLTFRFNFPQIMEPTWKMTNLSFIVLSSFKSWYDSIISTHSQDCFAESSVYKSTSVRKKKRKESLTLWNQNKLQLKTNSTTNGGLSSPASEAL